MDKCSDEQQQIEDGSGKLTRSEFENLLQIIDDAYGGLKKDQGPISRTIYQDSASEEDAGSCESGEEDDAALQRQSQSVQDLQAELTRLEIGEEASTLETLIVIVEHYVNIGDTEGFMKNIRRPDMWLTTSPRPRISDLAAMAENLQKQGLFFRAVMMHKAICALYKYEYVHHPSEEDPSDAITPNDAVTGIENCMNKVFGIFNDIFDKVECKVYLSHYVAVMYDMLTNLREILHAHRKYKADLEAWCMLYIAVVHGRLSELSEMRDVAEMIVKTAERRFKKKVQRHLVYGITMLTLALSYNLSITDLAQSDIPEKGRKYAEDAVKALQESKGMPSWDDKVKLVAKAEEFVKLLEGRSAEICLEQSE